MRVKFSGYNFSSFLICPDILFMLKTTQSKLKHLNIAHTLNLRLFSYQSTAKKKKKKKNRPMPCVTLISSWNSPSRHTEKVEESGNRSGVHRSHHLLLGRNHVYMPFFKPSSHFPSPNVPRNDRGNVRQRAIRASPSPAKQCQRSIQIQNSLCARWIA